MDVWLIESAKGIGKLFLNPLFYWIFILALMASVRRIKKERSQFGSKVFDVFSELKSTWAVSLTGGLLISLAAVAGGVVFSYPVLLLVSLSMILMTLAGRFTLLSPAYTFGLAYAVLLLVPALTENISFLWSDQLQNVNFTGLTLLLSAFLLIESLLFLRVKSSETFPELIKGNRGKLVGRHRLKKFAVVPFFCLVPAGTIEPFADWWPFFDIGSNSYGLVLLPFITGFDHAVKGVKPAIGAKKLGSAVLGLAVITLALAASSYWVSILSLAAMAVAVVGREYISYRFRTKDKQRQSYFYSTTNGVQILSIIPGTPAARLGLQVGEKIEKVNGFAVSNEQEFYEALQQKSAYCKLEVRDDQREIRFLQRAMYQGEPHELGIVFAKEQYRRTKKEELG
ncbi:PDZ domain-containing protein [Sediminibacillus massiliensis]|uniref:PDZ domain-containing protein n=1 Tax=Sediminibacillus massiliensis TaxID=1926277 RepID=UPI0009887D35|nr:PDZ domain-containing protein [Sediminibacillus massiliensis]